MAGDDPGALADGVIELRPWRDDDHAAVCAARDTSAAEASIWIHRQQARPPSVGVSRAIAPAGQPAVGYVGLIRRPRVELGVIRPLEPDALVFRAHRRNVGIGYWVAPGSQRRGFATRATRLLSRWALQGGGMRRVEALLDPANLASRRVVESSGFQLEGHLRDYLELDGRVTDALIFSLTPRDL